MMKLKAVLSELIFPNRCIFCGDITEFSHFICKSCLFNYPLKNQHYCFKCGKIRQSCICKNLSSATYRIISACNYEKAAITAIKRLKTDTESNIAMDFANLLKNIYYDSKESSDFSCVTYVPMEKEKEALRGHNMAKTLAEYFSLITGTKLIDPPVTKIYSEKFQHQLNFKERFYNANKVFVSKNQKINGNIILIDDVVTTGATMDTICRLLKENGAEKVLCLTIATTQLNKNER